MQDFVHLLALLLLANGAPFVAALVLGRTWSWPVDGGRRWRDGRPLFGPAKTWRGLLASMVVTLPTAGVLGLGWGTGLLVASGAMAGDLLSSFSKRRFGLASSASVPLLDQVAETLIPVLLVRAHLGLGWPEVLGLIVAFTVLDLLLTPLLRRLARDRARRH